MTAGPVRERDRVKGRIDALMAEAIALPRATTPEEIEAAMADARARSSCIKVFSRREGELDQTLTNRRAWAALIGLVACVGSFALCAAYWLGRGAKEAGQV